MSESELEEVSAAFTAIPRREISGDPAGPHTDAQGLFYSAESIGMRSEDIASFWRQVEKQSNGCWLWMGRRRWSGYGLFRGHGAHRIAYMLARGSIPEGLVLDHLCRVRPCVNPDHLEAVTDRENIRRGMVPAMNRAVRKRSRKPSGPPPANLAAHTFKRGQSGNPRGRPKKKPEIELARKALNELRQHHGCKKCLPVVERVEHALTLIATRRNP